jgi:hypothetical protein
MGVKICCRRKSRRTPTKRRTPIPAKIAFAAGNAYKKTLEQEFFTRKRLDIHQSNTLAKRGGKRIHDVHSRGDPFCESVVTILGLTERGDLISKDGKDSLGRIA